MHFAFETENLYPLVNLTRLNDKEEIRMSKRKFMILLAIPLIFTMVLSACAVAPDETPVPDTNGEELPPTGPEETPVMEETPDVDTPEVTPDVDVTPEDPVETPVTDDEQIGGTVSVLTVWGGSELDSFMAMVAPFEERTGIRVEHEGTRDLNAVLTTRVQGGNPPDVAGLPGPGQLLQFAREGTLLPLDEGIELQRLEQQYDAGWLDLARYDGQLYGVFIKGAVKSLVWYRPDAFEQAGYQVPQSWTELEQLEQQMIQDGNTPWCIGLESGAASGWPGTDWIEDIMLRTAGPEVYDQWWQHEIPWTDDSVRTAWEIFGERATDPDMVYGGSQNVLSMPFGEAPFPLFDDPPSCYMHRQASFIIDFIQEQFPDLEPGEDYDFFILPGQEGETAPLLVAGDLFGMFNDTPQSRALINYLTTPEAQQIWAERGGHLSPNVDVDPQVYPDPVSRQIAEALTDAEVRFDASDMMPEAVNNAFWSGILTYVSNPEALDSILQDIESTAQGAYVE
jgi:alpha-glucoside transport system substrate-binding protein